MYNFTLNTLHVVIYFKMQLEYFSLGLIATLLASTSARSLYADKAIAYNVNVAESFNTKRGVIDFSQDTVVSHHHTPDDFKPPRTIPS